jgi:hypothetical protein
MKKLIFAVLTIATASWMLVACSSGSSNNNATATCGAYGTSGYPYSSSPYQTTTNPYYQNGYNPYATNPYNQGSQYPYGVNSPCTNGISPYYGAYPQTSACNGNVVPAYSYSSQATYCLNPYYQNYYMPYASPTYYSGSYVWYIW